MCAMCNNMHTILSNSANEVIIGIKDYDYALMLFLKSIHLNFIKFSLKKIL